MYPHSNLKSHLINRDRLLQLTLIHYYLVILMLHFLPGIANSDNLHSRVSAGWILYTFALKSDGIVIVIVMIHFNLCEHEDSEMR